ncbi:MAG: holo-ACP synthase [Ignavibacterium sp.]|uniref:holo-ACP synthase n=1 Tax=Ignavibacterium sp. TaxID=2651167 RepID=UPI00404AA139
MVIGIGIDIIEIERIKKSIDRFGEHFINKIFTENEIKYCSSKYNKYQHYAARFAAKEAVYKALASSWQPIASWKSMEIVNEQSGIPKLVTFGKLREFLSDDKEIKISISHSDNYVTSVAIVYKKS